MLEACKRNRVALAQFGLLKVRKTRDYVLRERMLIGHHLLHPAASELIGIRNVLFV
jgi:hypothetical protein